MKNISSVIIDQLATAFKAYYCKGEGPKTCRNCEFINTCKWIDDQVIVKKVCPLCGNEFIQRSRREQVHCSPKCAAVVRMRAYRSRKEAQEDNQLENERND